MTTAEEIVRWVEQLADSSATDEEVLRGAVRILQQERDHYDWVGIYLLKDNTLVLHNYVGKSTEHTRIPVGVGVCGAAVADGENKIVGDVTKVDNYLACSLETRAEIVVLIRRGQEILGQIDIDSDRENAFSAEDESLLSHVAYVLSQRI